MGRPSTSSAWLYSSSAYSFTLSGAGFLRGARRQATACWRSPQHALRLDALAAVGHLRMMRFPSPATPDQPR